MPGNYETAALDTKGIENEYPNHPRYQERSLCNEYTIHGTEYPKREQAIQ